MNIKFTLIVVLCFFIFRPLEAEEINGMSDVTSIGMGLDHADLEIEGIVTDQNGEPLIGVNIQVKDTDKGTSTDLDGRFRLQNIDENSVLVVSYVGYQTQEVQLGGKTSLDIVLLTDSQLLDEIVVVGYGTNRRKDLTGSIVSVEAEEIAKVPVSNVSQTLAGRVSGVLVTQNEGEPGSDISIRVRGGISITQSNEPLYIIDGFPSDSGLDNLDPSEIESINILKDASSTSIYGSRGANGVVLVTTKGGKSGKTEVAYSGYFGIKNIDRKLPVLNTREYVLLDYERRNFDDEDDMRSFVNNYGSFLDIDKNYSARPGIDWQEEALGGSAFSQNHTVSVNGGVDNLRYYLSFSHFDEDGFFYGSGANKDRIRLRVNQNITDKLSVAANINYTQDAVFGLGTSDGGTYFNKMNHVLSYRPTYGMKGEDWELLEKGEDPILEDISGNVMQNPILSAKEEHRRREGRNVVANGELSYEFIKNLTFRSNFGIQYGTRRIEQFDRAESIVAKRTSINGSIRDNENQRFQNSNTLTYDNSINRFNFSIMLGEEYVTSWTRWFEASASNFPNDDIGLNDLSIGETPGIPRSFSNFDDKLLSFFTRGFFNFDERYLLTATLRADGSSKFGANNKWGIFPSASFAWRISDEGFFEGVSGVSDLKVRVGYGEAGNNRIPSYASLALLGAVTYPLNNSTKTGYSSIQIPNENLRWESNRTFNIGVDLGLFNNRISITPEYYINRSVDLLLNSLLPYTSGYETMLQNIGETENKGIDLGIQSVNINKNMFSWSTNFNLSFNQNKVLALAGEQSFLWDSNWGLRQNDYIISVGSPLGQIYGYITDGLYQVDDFDFNPDNGVYTLKEGIPYDPNNYPQPGFWKFKDIGGEVDDQGNPIPDGVIDPSDRTVIGNGSSKIYGGINNLFTYRNFDFSVFINFMFGNDVYNATKLYNTLGGRVHKNILDIADSENRWITIDEAGQRITDPNKLKEVNGSKTVAQYMDLQEGTIKTHSWGIEDGSFIRLNNLSLGYRFGSKTLQKMPFSKFRIYATANNLHVFTNYSGFDPEVSTRNTDGLTPGVDWGAYPRATSLVFGVDIAF